MAQQWQKNDLNQILEYLRQSFFLLLKTFLSDLQNEPQRNEIPISSKASGAVPKKKSKENVKFPFDSDDSDSDVELKPFLPNDPDLQIKILPDHLVRKILDRKL